MKQWIILTLAALILLGSFPAYAKGQRAYGWGQQHYCYQSCEYFYMFDDCEYDD